MARLIATGIVSLDGYLADAAGSFDWAMPSPEVHAAVNALERSAGTYLYGRRMWSTMRFWATAAAADDPDPIMRDYTRMWRAARKIVYSSSLTSTAVDGRPVDGVELERDFRAGVVRRMVEDAEKDVSIGGPTLATEAFRAGIVDEVRTFVKPVSVGGGLSFLPAGVRLELQLLEERRFADGTVLMRYRVKR